MVKPTDKEISFFRKYLKKQGFTVDGLCKDSYYMYMKYGYICVSIEYTKKGEFKEVRAFLSIWWENAKCSRLRKLDKDFVEKCTFTTTNVMVAINDMLEKIGSLLPRH